MPWIIRSSVLALLLLVVPRALVAQEIRGRLIEESTDLPIEAAAVTLLDMSDRKLSTTLSGSTGLFLLRVPAAGRYKLQADRIGYAAVVGGPIELTENDTLQVEFRLADDVIVLEPLVVLARAKVPYLNQVGFYRRRESGFGYFITRQQIQRQPSSVLTDLMRMIPGVRVVNSMPSRDVVFRGTDCRPRIIMDGVEARRGGKGRFPEGVLDDYALPHEIEGIEVYRGASELPAQFSGMFSGCGVIAIWTRDPRG